MTDSFLKKKAINKCTQCRVKELDINFKAKSSLWYTKGTGDILILVDMVEYDTMLKDFITYLDSKGLDSYQIHSTCLCRTNTFELPSPAYQVYNHCACVDLDKLKYKTVIAVGRTLSYLIQGDNFQYWGDFSEFLFNDTFFIHKEKRVYPVPCLSEWIKKDSFQSRFVMKQIGFIKEHMRNYNPFIVSPYEIIKVDEPNDFYRQYLNEECEMAWDTETSSLNHFDENFRVGCLTISFDGIKGYYLPFDKTTDKRLLSKFFSNKYQITANGKYDVKGMLRSGVQNSRVDEDITILAHLLNTERQKNGLKTLAWLVGLGGYDDELDKAMKAYNCETYLDIPEKILMHYAGMDAIATYRIWKYLEKELVPKQQMIYDTYKKYVIPVIPVFTKAEMRGMDIDIDYLNKLNSDIEMELLEKEKSIQEKLGLSFDINSNKQLGEALEKKGLPAVERKKDGGYKTGEAQLEYWKRKGFDVASDLLDYRGLMKLKTSFVGEVAAPEEKVDNFLMRDRKEKKVEGFAKYIRDGVIHPTFSPARTSSFRASSQNPNFQNIPKSGDSGKKTRKIFKCPDDYYICEADQSGFQLRIGAIYSGDEVMKDIFINRGGDMHSITARGVFARNISLEDFISKKGEEPYKTFRFKAKGINFGFLFGRGSFSFKSDLEESWTLDEIADYIKENKLTPITDRGGRQDLFLTVATDIRNKFFETYPGLEKWISSCIKEAQQLGYRDCPLGGRRHLPLMMFSDVTEPSNSKERAHYENIAVNSTVQTFEALIMYKAMIEIDKEIVKNNLKSIIVGMVHDSIVMYIHKSEVEQMYYIIKNAMEDYTSFNIPLQCEVEMGSVWGFSKEVTEKNLHEF
jgi:DNA polymerase-1